MKKILLSIACALVLIPSAAFAAEFRASKSGDEAVGATENVKNLYVAGTTVNSEARAKGDLVAAGQNLNINGSVEHSLLACGSNVNVGASVGTTARVMGGTVVFSGKTAEDLTAAGGTLSLMKDSEVAGDLMIAGGQLSLSGKVLGDAWIAGSTVTINGQINGDVVVRGAEQLTISKSAVINGNLKYYSSNTAVVEDGAVIKGATDYIKISQPSKYQKNGVMKMMMGMFSFYALIMTFLVLLALVYLFPKLSKSFVESSLKQFWPNLGWGFLTAIVAPIATLILLFTITGAKILGMVYMTALMLAVTAVPVFAGVLIMLWIKKKYQIDWLSVLVGIVATYILLFIPVIGWLALVALTLVALGEMTQKLLGLVKAQR